jgi:hypothetical protein
MTKYLFFFNFVLYANVLFSQSTLTNREAFDFAVSDTFQYEGSPNYYHALQPQPTVYTQVVVLSKRFLVGDNAWVYALQIDTYKPSQIIGPRLSRPEYIKSIDYFAVNNLDSLVWIAEKCPLITNPTAIWYCYDSIVTDYGNRKTLKHEFNKQRTRTGKLHYAKGIGLTLDQLTSEDPGSQKFYKMVYYNKNGDKWGTPIPELKTEKDKFKSLTNREAFNFSVGDTFWYKSNYVRINPNTYRCFESINFTKRVIKDKWFSPKKDTLYYSVQDSTGGKTNVYVKGYTNLDSLVEFAERKYALNIFQYFRDTTNYENNMKYTYITHSYGPVSISRRFIAGLGEIFVYIGDDTHCTGGLIAGITEELLYFKNGQKVWGNANLISSISTPSVSEAKITLSPNPVSDILHIDVDLLSYDIKIVNLQGKIIEKSRNASDIDVSRLPNSIYFLQIYEKGVLRGVRKFVVNR